MQNGADFQLFQREIKRQNYFFKLLEFDAFIFRIYNRYIRDGAGGRCEFDKDIQKIYIYNSCIFSYHLFHFLS